MANARLDDVTRQINQIDEAVTAAIRRGRAGGSMTLAERERRNRTALVAERDRLQQQVSDRTAGRAALSARQRLADSERMPIRYTEKLLEDVGVLPRGTDPEVVVNWLLLGFLLACDPLALALTMFAASQGGRPRRAR